MAGDTPLYVSGGNIAGPGGPSLQPQALPPSGGGEKIGEAVSAFGAEAGKVYGSLQAAQQHTKAAVATEKYLTQLSDLEETYSGKGADYATARGDFTAKQRELELQLGGEITDPGIRTLAMLQWRRAGLSAGKRVSHSALAKEQDVNAAALESQIQEGLTSASEAASPVERQAAVDRTVGAINSSVAAGWTNHVVGVQKSQAFVRSLSIADASRVIRSNPDQAVELLADAKNFPALDPQTLETLRAHAGNARDQGKIDQIEFTARNDPEAARELVRNGELQPHNVYRAITVIDAQEKHNAAALDKAAKDAAAATRASDKVLELVKQGYDQDPVTVENVRNTQIAAAQRGDKAAADYLQQLDLAVALQPHVRQAWSMPVAQLDSTIKRMDADLHAPGANPTPAQVTAYNAFKAVRDEVIKKRETEPITLGGENGARFYRLGPLDPNAAPDDVGFRAELARRNGHAAIAAETYGGGASALTAEEAHGLKERWGKAGPDEQFKLLRTFGETLSGRAYGDTVAAVAGDDGVTSLVGRLAQDRPELAREILQGQAVLGDAKTREKSQLVRAELMSKIGGMIYPDPAMQETAISAALALDAARRANKGALYDAADTSGVSKALDDVTGPIVKRNGLKVPLTPGIPRADFLSALDKLTSDDIKLQGGAIDRNGRELDPAVLRDRAQLKALSIGGPLYAVGLPDSKARDGFAPVFDLDGRPLVFDMRAIAAKHAGAIGPASSYQEARSRFKAGQFERLRAARQQGLTNEPAPPAPPPGAGDLPSIEE